MNYLQNRRNKNKKYYQIGFGIVFLIALFYFRSGIGGGLSYIAETFFHPAFVAGNNIGGRLKSIGSYFASKNSLYLENQNLKSELAADDARMTNYDSVMADDAGLKEILGRKDEKVNILVAAILAKPNQSPYDTLLIDAGKNQNIKTGDAVFALGDVPVGRVSDVYPSSAKVILFSNAGEKTQVVVSDKNIFMELVGRGGGNFEMIMPKDFTLSKGDQVVLPGITPHVVAITETIISDPRDPFTKALLTAPVNIQHQKFVEVEQ